jgi:REP element-mobilizing transposase RayT
VSEVHGRIVDGKEKSRESQVWEYYSLSVTYLITFVCYGCHLHGSEAGSVDPADNLPGSPTVKEDSASVAFEAQRMDQPPYHLDQPRRDAVLEAIQEVCLHRGWSLRAAHVRSNHVHTVVDAGVPPERVMSDFKAYASRRLNRINLDEPDRKRWARHGSTRWLWKPQHVSAAMQYVVVGQGDAMSVFDCHKV